MLQSFLFLLLLIVFPVVAQVRGKPAAALFFVAAFGYLLVAGIGYAQFQLNLTDAEQVSLGSQVTYYVVKRGFDSVFFGLIMIVLGTITHVQTLFGFMVYPVMTKVLFWIFHVGLLGVSSFQGTVFYVLPMPRRYLDYSEAFERYNLVVSWSAALTCIAFFALVVLLLWSAFLKRRSR